MLLSQRSRKRSPGYLLNRRFGSEVKSGPTRDNPQETPPHLIPTHTPLPIDGQHTHDSVWNETRFATSQHRCERNRTGQGLPASFLGPDPRCTSYVSPIAQPFFNVYGRETVSTPIVGLTTQPYSNSGAYRNYLVWILR